ncbi:MAG: hypothetical protein A3I11_00480 [Elusimicrobia bacterium RIFCSPLOWO2_02_FULL_39_32]|nr:MAG: hypothetical protein A2034_03490 [Elusimicrobia bacterium GWA2_38_7]OGR81555.1 MAG: hypothetical protein A3B80_06460 [Elusimicrobia bacterium RIFCSPHIGHO2_02_FULL_39_36]OGR91599.1 MAG: hypothetical protein A3I11_00480 [Elusimicrobia bacterium RIFCSPLOWO2_02_FULL_39_32]OGR98826.1 MAG: hypothetical protein A3G85_08645 [Elusimicrobia bacterium RIFCSPLOWO2_12_FULL_39_28]
MTNFEEDYSFDCPYCMETNDIRIDLTGGKKQQFIYDCEICCHPILIKLEVSSKGIKNFFAEKE